MASRLNPRRSWPDLQLTALVGKLSIRSQAQPVLTLGAGPRYCSPSTSAQGTITAGLAVIAAVALTQRSGRVTRT